MSYHLQYIKKKVIKESEIDRLVENKANPDDEHFISAEEQEELVNKITSFFPDHKDIDRSPDHEIHYDSLSVDIADNGALVTVLYWNENNAEDLEARVRKITEIFTESGFTCYNRQSGEFVKNQEQIDGMFEDAPWVVEKSLTRTANARIRLVYLFVLIAIIAVAILLAYYIG